MQMTVSTPHADQTTAENQQGPGTTANEHELGVLRPVCENSQDPATKRELDAVAGTKSSSAVQGVNHAEQSPKHVTIHVSLGRDDRIGAVMQTLWKQFSDTALLRSKRHSELMNNLVEQANAASEVAKAEVCTARQHVAGTHLSGWICGVGMTCVVCSPIHSQLLARQQLEQENKVLAARYVDAATRFSRRVVSLGMLPLVRACVAWLRELCVCVRACVRAWCTGVWLDSLFRPPHALAFARCQSPVSLLITFDD